MSFPNSCFVRNGDYQVLGVLGKGAGGEVIHAKDRLRREVAVKEALPSHRNFYDTQARFETEARIQATLQHSHIIHVYHLEKEPHTDELYLICEYANGGSLAEYLQAHGPLTEEQAVYIALDVCLALEEVSRQRFVHRDVKPSNIILVKDAQGTIKTAKLTDFGIAKDLDKKRAGPATTIRRGNQSHPGTPEYMAPEQADITKSVDVRTDIYALGITMWEMLTGTDYKAELAQQGNPDLRAYNAQTSPAIAKIIQRAVQTNPTQRFQTATEFKDALASLLGTKQLAPKLTIPLIPQKPRQGTKIRRGRLGVVVPLVVIALLVATAFFMFGDKVGGAVPSTTATAPREETTAPKPATTPTVAGVEAPAPAPATTAPSPRPPTNTPVVPTTTTAPPTPDPGSEVLPESGQVTVTADNLNVRSQPNTDGQSITTLARCTTVNVLGRTRNGSWWSIQTPQGVPGYISARYAERGVCASPTTIPPTNTPVVPTAAPRLPTNTPFPTSTPTRVQPIELGGVDVISYCRDEFGGYAIVSKPGERATAFTWNCVVDTPNGPIYYGVSMDKACRIQYRDATAFARTLDPNSPISWRCYLP